TPWLNRARRGWAHFIPRPAAVAQPPNRSRFQGHLEPPAHEHATARHAPDGEGHRPSKPGIVAVLPQAASSPARPWGLFWGLDTARDLLEPGETGRFGQGSIRRHAPRKRPIVAALREPHGST